MHTSGENGAPGCPESVLELVARFELHRDTYKKPTYNETQVRREFIDPLFAALGWDIDNEQGNAEAYKDVIHEDAIKVGGSTKAPDYCFRIGGVRKFFVEAKKPSEDIKQKREHAYQLRRYAWTAKLPVSILTDFEELAVFDCTKRPKPTDTASTGRILYVTFDEYSQRWGEISSVFSKDAILKGAFDKYAESAKRKRGTSEVDDEFLKEIEQWRDLLARNIALRNQSLTVRELNYAVSKTIDRIIFLRMCEDRGVETYAQLSILPNGPGIYPRLVELFRRADERYNSGLFHFEHEKGRTEEPDTLTPGLTIDDKVLKDIIRSLYYPECPYEFSVMPSEILGQVYEQFLGKVITLTAGHRAKIESKPEVKKAGGVYYTPKYIVDYIVEHTVGKLLEGKTPADVGPMFDQRRSRAREEAGKQSRQRKRRVPTLCILDPACGSGSFLLGAYQYLLDWHLRWYTDDDPEAWARKRNPPICQSAKPDPTARGTTWRLTVAERKRILLNNLFGVDIDPQAVEVTKLSLLLKVLEGESQQTLDNQLRLFHERALPDLASNVKCGNSLIGPDFYDGKQLDLLDEEERYRINVFDWEAEFPEIFKPSRDREGADKTGGFDAVIGNPPYVSMLQLDKSQHPSIKPYWKRTYESAAGAYDIYVLFVERGVLLARVGGYLSYILPNKFLAAEYAREFRQWLLANTQFLSLLDFSRVRVWAASVYPVVPVFSKGPARSGLEVKVALATQASTQELRSMTSVPYHLLSKVPDNIWSFLTQRSARLLFKVLQDSVPLSVLGDVCGATTVAEGSEYPSLLTEQPEDPIVEDISRFVVSGSITRYATTWESNPVRFTHQQYIRPYIRLAPPMPARRIDQALSSKILICKVALEPRAFLDVSGEYVGAYTTYILPRELSLYYLTGVINSHLMALIFRTLYDALALGSGYLRFQPPQVRRLPIRTIDFTDTGDVSRHDRMVELVDRMLGLHKQLGAAKTPTDKTAIGRQIDATDRQIDNLVYELYGLTEDEIRLVEDPTAEQSHKKG